MTQRNALLRAIRDGESQAAELAFWDEQLADHGALILAKRLATVAQVQTLASRFYAEVAGPEEPLQVAYDPNLADLPDSQAGIRVALTREIARRRAQETASGQSLVGPHRDDVTLLVRGSPVARYGSRGQARSVALALRLAEARLIAQARGEEPVLLLDDILSELDAPRRRQVMAAAARAEQALLTAADLLDFRELGLAAAARYRVTPGKVERTEAPD
jgi:DNA replication and repair protein RecF